MPEFNEGGTYTAWQLAADWEWMDAGLEAVRVGGRVAWETVTCTKGGDGQTVRLSRLETRNGLRAVNEHVSPDTPMRLRKIGGVR